MAIKKWRLLSLMTLFAFVITIGSGAVTNLSLPEAMADTPSNPPLLKALIILQNRTTEISQENMGSLNDFLTTNLVQQGFQIIDRAYAQKKISELGDQNTTQTADLQKALAYVQELSKFVQGDKSVQGMDINDGSATRIAQMLGAKYLVVGIVSAYNEERRTFKGDGTVYKTDTSVILDTMHVSLRVMDAVTGAAIYSDTVSATEKIPVLTNLEIQSNAVPAHLMEIGANLISENISSKMTAIKNVKLETLDGSKFEINSNIDGATVEMDGVVIGSASGKLSASSGVHQMKITKEFFTPWERTVNIHDDQVITVTMELTKDGLARFKDVENYKLQMAKEKQDMDLAKKQADAQIDINKEQSAADAYAKKKQADSNQAVSEGEKTKRENSYIHDNGASQ